MSEQNGIVDESPAATTPESPPPVEETPQVAAPAVDADDDHPEAVADAAGQRFVPVSALQAVRGELKALKPHAERAQQLEAWANDVRPYVEFLKANPQLLQPQAPAPAGPPQVDPALVELARTLELYDATTGQPDVARASVIRDMTRMEAAQIAQATMAPVQERTHEQQAAANLQAITATTDADGRPLEQAYVMQAVRQITDSLPKAEALRVLADARVANLIRFTALGLQSAQKKSGPAAPATPPLHIETAGGGSGYVMTEESRKLARAAGVPEKEWTERARAYRPGQSNVLE